MYLDPEKTIIGRDIKNDPEEVQAAIQLLADSFASGNQIWKKLKIDRNEAYEIVKDRVLKYLPVGFTAVAIRVEKSEIVMAQFALDLVDYLELKDSIKTNKKFDPILKSSIELQNLYYEELKPKRGEYIYGDLTAIKSSFSGKHIALSFWMMGFRMFSEKGYKAFIVRSTNRISSKNLQMVGGEILKRVNLGG